MEDFSGSERSKSPRRNPKEQRKLLSFNIRKILSEVEPCTRKKSLAERLNSRLYQKYCSSQNFFYTKEIDNILCGIKSAGSIQHTEEAAYLTELERQEEMLKRYYRMAEYPKKIKLLCEYYKFHEDVPRLAMLPLSSLIHNYHDQKRRINYIKITKMLNNGKIDSEIIRNMDPNEDSEYSKCSVASSLLSFLPEEFKFNFNNPQNPGKGKEKKNGKRSLKTKRGKRGKSTQKESWQGRSPLRSRSKNRDAPNKYSRKNKNKLSPISGKKEGFYLTHILKKNKQKSKL
jgi:hypothetical protein